MKASIPIVIVTILIGISLGWLLKPGPEAGDEGQAVAEEKDQELQRVNTRERPNLPSTRGMNEVPRPPKSNASTMILGADGEMNEQTKAIHGRMMDAMAERREKQDEAKIAALVTKLGLSPAQEAKLREQFERRRVALADMLSGKDGAVSLDLLKGDGLDEFAANELTAEQQELYEADKKRTRQRQVESKALKDLAQINDVVDVRPEQRDALYQVLYDRADASVGQETVETRAAALVADGLGIPLDSGTIGASLVVPDGAGQPDGTAILAQMKEQRQKQVEEQVEAVSGVLDEQQIQTYRTHLETRGSFLESVIPQ